ncbi:hypothetical protein [Gemmata sp.]|uniref:hypothetical protein n=1 Tax=Gemmata sp. TaxID=1914242 RepID=UPI003F716797
MHDIERAIDEIVGKHKNNSNRLQPLADYLVRLFAALGLPDTRGGSTAELRIPGLARRKDWDVAYDFAGKPRLLVSLKSIWANASGTVPNRIDDLMGEVANAQQMSPELVTGYVMLFNVDEDGLRKEDGRSWSQFLEEAIRTIAIRKAPLWNQGLIEGFWFIRFDTARPVGDRVVDLQSTESKGVSFVSALLAELRRREPAVPFVPPATPAPGT